MIREIQLQIINLGFMVLLLISKLAIQVIRIIFNSGFSALI